MNKTLLSIIVIFSFLISKAETQGLPVLKVSYPGTLVYESYTQGEMTLEDIDGKVVELPARFKTRGATARRYHMKPSFNMKLEDEAGNEYDTDLLGIREASSWILDAMAIDRICMRNRICFDIWNELYRLPYETDFDGRDGTSGKFVEVYMNGEYKGIFCLSDKINRKLLDLKKPQIEDNGEVTYRGILYKQGTNDLADQNTKGFFNDFMVCVAAWHDAWELHEPDDYPSKEVWAPLLDYYANSQNRDYINQYFFPDNLVDYTLLIMALSISDNWGNKNKYFSLRNIQKNDDNSRFIITPWDLDTSLGGHYEGNYYDGNYSQWRPADMMKSASSPFSIFYTDSEATNRLKSRWEETRKNVFSVTNINEKLQDYCDLFISTGAWQRQVDFWKGKSGPKHVEDLQKEINLIKEWYADRFDQMDNYFGVSEAGADELFNDSNDDSPYYNLQGIKVAPDKLRKGEIYIHKGRKISYR